MPRRRIDRLMLSLTTSVALASGATSLLTQNLLYLPQIAIPLLLWLQLRRKIPSNGLGTDTTEGNPHTILLLVWLSLCLALAMIDRNKMKLIRSIGLGYPFPRSISIDLGLLLIRLATGIFLCTVFEKFLPRDGRWGPQDWFIADIAKMGFPFPSFFAWCAVLSEFFGGILLALGLLARPAAFFNAVTTFVAAFVFHKGDVSGSALLGTVFFASTLGLTLTGPGRISIDYLILRLWTTASTTGDH